jgi:Domain of unknown function (DUF4388)
MQLAGELSKISLPSLIQLLRNGQLTGKVCLTQGTNTAFIYVADGRVVHAETDSEQGRAALLELFLWLTGTFSLVQTDLAGVVHTLSVDESVEKVIREGLVYLEKKKHLDQLRINSRTILKPTTARVLDNAIYSKLNGRSTLGELAATLNMRRFEYINCVYDMLVQGHAVVVDQPAQDDAVNLPAWVVSRLKQDNPDLTQSIVQMVIWVDRVKCWMYQADADMERIVGELSGAVASESGITSGAQSAASSSAPQSKLIETPVEGPAGVEF